MGNVTDVKVAKMNIFAANVVMVSVEFVIKEGGYHLHVVQIFSFVQDVPNIFGRPGVFLVGKYVVQIVVNYVGSVMLQHAKNVLIWEKGIVVKYKKVFPLSCK